MSISVPLFPQKQEVNRTVTFSAPDAISRQRSTTPHQVQRVTWTGLTQQLFGYALAEMNETEAWWLDRVHAEDVGAVLETLTSHLLPAQGSPFAACARICGLEYRFRHANGHYVQCSERYITTRDEEGTATRTDGTIFDTEARQIERQNHAVRLSPQTQLAIVAQNTPSGIFMMDPNGYPTFMNAAAELLTGFKFEEMRHHMFHSAVHSCRPNGEPYPAHECPVFTTQQAGTAAKDQPEVFIHKDGHFFDVVYSVSPVESYSTGGCVIEFRDVSDEKRVERERLDALLMNEQQSIRIKESEIHKTNMTSFVSFVCHELRNPLQGVTSSAEILTETLQKINDLAHNLTIPRNGSFSTAQPTSSAANEHLNLGKSDTTDGRSIQHQQNQSLANSGTMAELENLMSYAKQLVVNIQTCAEHQALITNNVLDLSRLDAGKVEPVFDVVDVQTLGQQSVSMMMSKARGKSIHLSLAESARTPIYLKADATLLAQVLLNLVGNAIKFTPENGAITIDMYSEQPDELGQVKLNVSVTDTGLGMTEAEQQKLFQRFSQANRRVAQLYGGSGLGLSISKELVRVMGGEMHVKSAQGKGSTFSFTSLHDRPTKQEMADFLRLQNLAQTQTQTGDVSALYADQPPKFEMIGVAEDNPINLKLLAKHLGALGYSCVLCTNGQEILEKFRTPDSTIDAVIMDMSMPVMDGLQSATLMREFERSHDGGSQKASQTPIIALSGNALKEQVTDALAAGISDYLIKPCKQADLARTLKYWERIVHTGAPHEPTFNKARNAGL